MNSDFPVERLQPSLLNRLKSDETSSGNGSKDSVWTMKPLRTALLEDLELLFNSTAKNASHEIYEYELAAKSVYNFGLPGLAGVFDFRYHPEAVAAMLHDAIEAFEPRVVPGSLTVTAQADDNGTGELRMEISCNFCPLPTAESLFVHAVLDMESGGVKILGRFDE